MRIGTLKPLLVVGVVAGLLLAPAVFAAAAPEIHSVSEGRDPASSRPLVILQGKRLTKLRSFSLFASDGLTPAGLAQPISTRSTTTVVGLPASLASGTYVLVASDGRGNDESLTVSVGNGQPLPASIAAEALSPSLRSDLDDAATLEGHAAAYFGDASNLTAGALSTDRFSAYGDLVAESRVGTGAGQLAAGDHEHEAVYARKALVGVKVSLSGQYNSSGGGEQVLPFDIEEFDPQGSHSSGSPSRLTCVQPGYYHVGARLAFTANPVALTVKIRKNGATVVSASTAEYGGGGTLVAQETSTYVHLDVDDYLEVVWPNNIPLRGGTAATEFFMVRIGE
jgi:hypothetical protein